MSDKPPYPSFTKLFHNKAQPSTLPTRPELLTKGKSIVVTGGGVGGIGGETARYFAAAGASRIAILGRRQKPLADNKAYIEEHYPEVEVVAIPTDVTKQADVDAAFATITKEGIISIDVLVSSAAEIGLREPVAQADGTAYLQTVNNNVAAALWLTKAFARHAKPEDAVVIAISSWAAHWSAMDIFSAYSVAKIAVVRLWDTFMLSNPNIRVVHTQPGVVLTEMNLREGGAKSFEGIPIDDGKMCGKIVPVING
jgi:NAD(P)-dependent dehydrogenase (short-subunit alcohol dehydrogenase family)